MIKKFNESYFSKIIFDILMNEEKIHINKIYFFFRKEFTFNSENEVKLKIIDKYLRFPEYKFLFVLHNSFIYKVYSDLLSYNTIIDDYERNKLIYILLQLIKIESFYFEI